jgi:troponin T
VQKFRYGHNFGGTKLHFHPVLTPLKAIFHACLTGSRGDGNFLKARQEAKKGELDEQLKEYINEWRKQRAKEEEELKRLKDKQAKRKEIRAEQEKKLAQQKKEEEERLRKEEADKKAKEAEEKRKRLEEAEKKRQAMMQAQKEKQQAAGQGAKVTKNNFKQYCLYCLYWYFTVT